MFDRVAAADNFGIAAEAGSGIIVFSPLAQGLLTDKYLDGVPADSRAAKSTGYLKLSQVSSDKVAKARRLNELASRRGQSLAQMALAWILADSRVTSIIVGASSVKQLTNNLATLDSKLDFSSEELNEIEAILS